jgi:hypothetical protein
MAAVTAAICSFRPQPKFGAPRLSNLITHIA